jgi:hypothetical protein
MDVETVYASVDATAAGGAVTAEITIADQSGVVIARKVQGSTIAAGGTGSATWALRLDDETTAATPSGSLLNQQLTWSSPSVPSGGGRGCQFFASSGSSLFDVSGINLNAPKAITAGAYIVTINAFGAVNAGWTAGSTYLLTLTFAGVEFIQRLSVGPNGIATVAALDSLGCPWQFAVNDTFTLDVNNGDSAHSHTWSGDCLIQQLG